MISTVKLHGSEWFNTKIAVHTATKHSDVSLAQEFQNHLSDESRKHGILDQVKDPKKGKKIRQTGSSMFKIINMLIIIYEDELCKKQLT